LKMAAFWDIALCSLAEVDRRFRDVYCFHHKGDDGGIFIKRLLKDKPCQIYHK
jgi:hypothetical protein